MPLQVKIPPLGESIASGILAKWHVANGATVKKGQTLFELETDKITSEGTAEADGVITLAVAEGAEVKIGAVVATATTRPTNRRSPSPSSTARSPSTRRFPNSTAASSSPPACSPRPKPMR